MERRLAAVLIADIVGYVRHSQIDEEGTRARFQVDLHDVFEPGIAAHHGRLIKTMGDALLVEFHSVVDAVRCAVEFQQTKAERNASVTEDERLVYRIGVNLGDVIVEGDDIQGDGVNIADRLQELAEDGGICISGTVFEQIEGKVDHRFIDLGTRQIKNIPKPVHVYGDFARVTNKSREAKSRPLLDAVESESAIQATGGCLCGDIRYEIVKPAIDSLYCHCKMCQRFSGAPVIAGATFPKDGVRFTKGKPTYYRSSAIAERGFCPRCGSSLTYKPVARRWTDWIFIFAGSFDKGLEFLPEWHLGIESHVPWLSIPDELPKVRCDESPSLVQAYAEAEKYE